VALIRRGGAARLSVPERAGQTWPARVESMAQAIDAGSGAMLVQLVVDNAAGELLPGGFGTVRFDMAAAPANVVTVPPGALIVGKDGVQVATVDQGSHVRLKRVTVGRDLGNVVELAGGVERADSIIDSPPDGVADGDLVRVANAGRRAAL
jgi:multidrug efflux pump subunit AcrA (membrane-fusion protein)